MSTDLNAADAATETAPAGSDTRTDTPPATDDARRRRKRVAAVLIVILLLMFGLIVGWYLTHRDPLPVPGLAKQPLPHYAFSIYGTTRPMGVATSPDGSRVYVTGTDGEKVVAVFDRAGHKTGTLRPPASTGPVHLPVYVAVDPRTGQVYVSDRAAAAVYVYGTGGDYRRTLVPRGLPTTPAPAHASTQPGDAVSKPIWQPLGLGFDDRGRLYVTEVGSTRHRVLVLSRDGQVLRTIGAGDHLSFPNGVAIGPDGHVFVTDSNNGRLLIFSARGRQLTAVNRGVGEGDLGLPRGLAFGDSDRLYVVDTSSHTVKTYRQADDSDHPAPAYVGTFGGEGQLDGAFEYPNGVATDGHNRVYITDRENNRVQVWTY